MTVVCKSETEMSISHWHRIVVSMSMMWMLTASPTTAQPERGPSPDGAIPIRVAILPFDNIGGAPGDEWIGAGLIETVTTDLESLRNMTVIAQDRVGAIFDRRGNEQLDATALASLGRELSARWVMAGSYQRQGDELRADDFLVFDPSLQNRGRVPWIQNRQLAVKMTYLLSR